MRHAAQMRANAHHHEKLFLAADHAVLVGGRIAVLDIGVAGIGIDQFFDRHGLGRFDLLGRAVADENRIAAPLEGDLLAFGDRRQVDFDRGQRQHRGVGIHLADEGPGRQRRADSATAPVAM